MYEGLLPVAVLISSVLSAASACPHESGYRRWSNAGGWTGGKPTAGSNVMISDSVMVDENTPGFYNVTIAASGALTFDPKVDLKFRAANIIVNGRFEIGSETCPYTGNLEITLTGTRTDHAGERDPKAILVTSGGTIDIHGEPKRSWTKLQGTILPDRNNKAILYDHEINGTGATEKWMEGIAAYTVALKGNSYEIVKFGCYHLSWMSKQLAAHINSVRDGEILMMASQMRIFVDVNVTDRFLVYDAFETLVSGERTGKSILRSLDKSDGSTWAFVMQKGNAGSVKETTNPRGVTSQVVFQTPNGLFLMAETKGDAGALWGQGDNFRIASSLDGVYPRITVIDDVTTWLPGDKIAIATTDYDPIQTEEAEIIFCGDCLHNQFRIKKRPVYMHYGEMVAGSVDMRTEVAMLTRKVVIRGEMEAVCPKNNGNCNDTIVNGLDTFGAHIKVLLGYANARMSNFELRQAGQQTDLGRYPIHFHMAFNKIPSAAVPYIRSVSIHNTFARCITIHGSHGVLVKDNVCYRPMGHGFFLEDGGEMNNAFDGNLAMNVLKGTLEPTDKTRPSGFWMTNPKNSFVNNVAAGGYGNGIWFIFPDAPLSPSREFITQEGLMTAGEAKRTMISAFENNLAHSNDGFGIMIGNRLKDDRNLDCCNFWQPLADPKNNKSAELQIVLQRITGYKNRAVNIWIEGGLLDVSRLSSADSINGVFVSNEGQQFQRAGKVSRSVVIGQSPNKGLPTVAGVDHSLPIPWMQWASTVQTGITMWKGPTKYSDIWFDKFSSNSVYDIAAIGKNRQSPYFFSVQTEFTNISFAFDDQTGGGTYALSGKKTDRGWENNLDGELISGFTFNTRQNGNDVKYYVVKPDPLSAAAADCKLRPNWRLAMCTTKYGNLQYSGKTDDKMKVQFVRDQVPSAQLQFEMKTGTGPQVVLDGSSTYTVHFTPFTKDWLWFRVPGMEKGDVLRVGVCTPRGATFNLQSFFPYNLWSKHLFTAVNSLAELDRKDPLLDGKKYFYNATTGMIYYKFLNTQTKTLDEDLECNNGHCPEFRVIISGGNMNDSDCRSRIYTSTQLSTAAPALPEFKDVMAANSGSTPPVGYGAGPMAPFRADVNGGWSEWQTWSTCSRTCGEGTQYRLRKCNNPLPEGKGASCIGTNSETRACQVRFCAIKGKFSDWTEWSACSALPSNDETYKCSGRSERTRACDAPPAQYNGELCEGYSLEIKSCSLCSN